MRVCLPNYTWFSHGFQSSESSEHASLKSGEFVSGQQQLQDSTRPVKRTLADVSQFVVAQVSI